MNDKYDRRSQRTRRLQKSMTAKIEQRLAAGGQ